MRQDAKAVVDSIEQREERVHAARNERPRLTSLQQIDGVADGQQPRRLFLADGDVGPSQLQLEGGGACRDVPDGGVEDERGGVDGPSVKSFSRYSSVGAPPEV